MPDFFVPDTHLLHSLLLYEALADTWWLVMGLACLAGGAVYRWKHGHLSQLRQLNLEMQRKMDERAQVVLNQRLVIQKKVEELEKSYQDFTIMSRIGQELTTTLDLEEVFENLYEQVNMLMDAEIFAVNLYHPDTELIEFKYIMEKGERQPVMFQPLSRATLGSYSIRNQTEVFINNLDEEYTRFQLQAPTALQGHKPESILYVPLMLRGELLGVISVQSFAKNAYTHEHLSFLRILASYTAIAIGNGRAYELLEQANASVKQQNERLQQANELIERNNGAILDSLEYAKRIQTAIMPAMADIKKGLPNSFIYYRSKDIVSGDFYWYMTRGDVTILAAVDCTGHGVPGAFMSVLGNTLLNNIIREGQQYVPGIILDTLDERVVQMLNQMDPNSDAADGMDIALCSLDRKTHTLSFAGANRPLHYVQGRELKEIRGDKYPIGGKNNIHGPYTTHSIKLEPGDTFYISTDGFADQFGGRMHRKFLNKRFKQLLADLYRLDIGLQQEILNDAFETWKGDEKQLDDILVIGVRL